MDTKKQIQQQIYNCVIHQPIEIDIGYGGVLFVEIGPILEPAHSWGSGVFYRQMYFFVNEIWEIYHKEKKVVSRFGKEDDTIVVKILKEIANKKVTDFSISDSYENTTIAIGDYKLIIKQTEELSTWDFYHRTKSFCFTLTGKKELISREYVFEKPKKYTHRPRKKTDFDLFYKENLPLSQPNAEKLLSPLIGFVVHEVREYSAIAFTLESEDESLLISIDSDWQLMLENTEVMSSRENRYTFIDKLTEHLLGRKIKSFSLNRKNFSLTIKFSGKLTVNVEKSKRYSLWTVFHHSKGYHVSADQKGHFDHIIICPEKLKDKYLAHKHGDAIANCLYALDVYRKLIA